MIISYQKCLQMRLKVFEGVNINIYSRGDTNE
jgi:hypothetical protein